MASTMAPAGPFRATAVGTTPPLRQLWQVPTFVVGLLALAVACCVRPPWQFPRTCHEDPSLAELREFFKQSDFAQDRALKLGAEAVQGARTPAAAAEAHFLLGSAYVSLAEAGGPAKGPSPWREARGHLEQALALGVPEEDRPRLDYRLAKAWAQTGEAPAKVIPALLGSIEAGADDDVDAARGYGLLAEAYLKPPKPDPEAALEATVKQIDRAIVDDAVLGPARLRRGELLVRLDRQAEALDVLKNVGPRTSPEVAARARRLRVRVLEQTESWDQAAPVWREILDDGRSPPPDRATVLYHLGLCLRNGGPRDEALRAWEDCLRDGGPGGEGPAAALGVAELRLRDGQVEPALAAFERVVRDVKQPDDWQNSLVPLARAREVFEGGCKSMAARGAFEPAARLAGLYERLAPPGRAQQLRAEAAFAGARAAQDRARTSAGVESLKLYGEAEALLRQAGEAYAQAADAESDPGEQGERLWSAANRFLEGRDAKRAIGAFQRFLGVAQQPAQMAARRFNGRLNEGWYKLAVACREADDGKGAETYFGKAAGRLDVGSPYVYRARYELALMKKEPDGNGGWRWTDQAEAELEKNLTQLRTEFTDRDEEAREKTLYALGDLYFERREQRDAISRAIDTLDEALRDFPNNAQALAARYELAESYRLRADQRSTNLSQEQVSVDARLGIEKKVMEDREKAIANYRELSRALEARAGRDEADERLLVYALSAAADVRYWAGGYEQSGEMYDALVERLRDRKGYEFELLNALGNEVRAYLEAARWVPTTEPDSEARVRAFRQKAQRALGEIRAGLPRLDPEAHKGFEKWLRSFGPG